jgi:hypothetical protein
MVRCNKCGTNYDVSLALASSDEVRVASCRVCPVDRIFAVCERCADLNEIESNPCPWCGATHMWEIRKMISV